MPQAPSLGRQAGLAAAPAPAILGRGALGLASLLALAGLHLDGAQGLVRRAADGAEHRRGALQQRVHVFLGEALLHLDNRSRIGKAEQLLGHAQVGLHDALDQAGHAVLHVAQPTLGSLGQRHEMAHVLGRALRRLGDLAADGLKRLRRVLGDLPLAFGQGLRAPAHRLVCGLADPAHRVDPRLGALARHVRRRIGAPACRFSRSVGALLGCRSALMNGSFCRLGFSPNVGPYCRLTAGGPCALQLIDV